MAYIYLICAFTLNAIANILLKVGSEKGIVLLSYSPILFFKNNWPFLLGLSLFVLNVIFYFLALRVTPLSVAYPVMVIMSFLIINLYAYFFLGEKITSMQFVGYVMIVLGIILVFFFSNRATV